MTTSAEQQARQGGMFSDRTVVEIARRSSPQHSARPSVSWWQRAAGTIFRSPGAAVIRQPRNLERLSGRAEDWSEMQHDTAQGLRLDECEKSAVATMA